VFVLGNKGFAGIWFAAVPDASVTNPRMIDGCNVVFNLGENHTTAPVGAWGIEIQNGGTVNYIVRNSIIAGNTDRGLVISALTGTGTVTVENVTIANNGTQAIEVAAGYNSNISITDSILAGNGTSNATNVITHNGGGTMDISYSAIVTAGPSALLTPPTTGTGVINLSNVVNADPQFVDTTTFTSTSFFDVAEMAYAFANSTGNGLGGGADYVGGTPTPTPTPIPLLSARNWNIYE
jgi:hypothetical protein